MTPGRLDDLLERALATGLIPLDATPGEAAELAPMLAAAWELRLNAAAVAGEADRAMPAARARFQRHLAAERPADPVAVAVERGRFGWFFGARTMAVVSSAAALAVVAVVALVVLRPFGGVETVAALTIDDYVQVEGVVSAAGAGTVTVQSAEIGNLAVSLSDLTAVTDEAGARDPGSLRPGDPVLVSGIVTAKRAINASNVSVSRNRPAPTPQGDLTRLPLLKDFRPLQGTVRMIALSPDGANARVLLVTPSEQILVDIDPRSMDQFLALSPLAVGAGVRVAEAGDLGRGVFRLEPLDRPGGTLTPEPVRPNAPRFQNVRGVVVGRNLNVLMVRTERGTVPVVLRPLTSVRFGESGLTPDDIRAGESVVGYAIAITGSVEPGGNRIVASIIVVLEKAAERPAR